MKDCCPLCTASEIEPFYSEQRQSRSRDYFQCDSCGLVFVPKLQHLSPAEEKAVYDLHENDPEDAGYRRFLSRLVDPISAQLDPGAKGLDFGCGPGPAIASMMAKRGFEVMNYDPFYSDNERLLADKYDFICATEVIEHVSDPKSLVPALLGMLKPGGVLGLMTKLVISAERFANWHYKNDPTHICFYSEKTFHYISTEFGAELEIIGSDVILLRPEN